MSKTRIFRFAVGSSEEPFSGVWRIVASRDEVYIGASKLSMGVFKISLHKSGVWILAATRQSGATFENNNRRAKQWKRPLEHARGVIRGPSVLIPRTSLGSRILNPGEADKKVYWYQKPENGQTVELSFYFVQKGVPTSWAEHETVVETFQLSQGGRMIALASIRQSTQSFSDTCEKLLRENIFRMDNVGAFRGGNFLWFTESDDGLRVPIVVDLPLAVQPQLNHT